VTGLLASRSMRGAFVLAVLSALLAALVGFCISVPFDLPSGPAIIATSGVLAALAWVVRRVRA
jgi:ABC-type Mn2+/Zn2+ transport system permease subunit